MTQTLTRIFPDGDFATRLDEAMEALQSAIKDEKEGKSLTLLAGEEPPSSVLADEYSAIKAAAEKDAKKKNRVVTLRAIGRTAWRNLKDAHPPRTASDSVPEEDAEADKRVGVNFSTIEDDLVFATISEPKFTSRAAFDEWADTLSEGEWQVLVRDAWGLVNGARFDPKPLPALPTQRNAKS